MDVVSDVSDAGSDYIDLLIAINFSQNNTPARGTPYGVQLLLAPTGGTLSWYGTLLAL